MINFHALNTIHLNSGQKIAIKYFSMAIVIFVVQIVFGILAGTQFNNPEFLYQIIDFNVNRMVHINAMIIWLLYGFIGSVYWLIEDEAKTELVGKKLANFGFWILTIAVLIVVLVFLFIQDGEGSHASIWLINEGREYIEAPRWADIGIVFVMLIFFYNIYATFIKGKWSGIAGVLVLDLAALAGVYLAGMFYSDNISMDQFWWWWVIHLWVEATWEVLVGCIMAWVLMKTINASRRIVTTWLYIEVTLMLGSGVLGLGHHYFWIGTPEYWLTIGGFFSALEPIPLVAMLVHALYDSGVKNFKSTNNPALAWLIAHAFGNFFGAGVWGFFQTLPQINLYTHGTQWTASHGHLAFFGAYATINIAMFYMAIQAWRGNIHMGSSLIDNGWKWKTSLTLLNIGIVGMTIAMLIAGYKQSFIERAVEGSTWSGYFKAQSDPSFMLAMDWRMTFGWIMALGLIILIWDLITIGSHSEMKNNKSKLLST